MLKYFKISFLSLSFMMASQGQAGVLINSLDKTNSTGEYVKVERCQDGGLAIVSDIKKLTSYGISSACEAVVRSPSTPSFKKIGTKMMIEVGLTGNGTSTLAFNSIADGFLIYGDQSDKDFLEMVNRCLLLMKNNLANEIIIYKAGPAVTCRSM